MVILLASITTQSATRAFVAGGLLIAAAIVLFLGLWYYRRRWMDVDNFPEAAWTFEDLQKLREKGDLTEEEYQALRSALKNSFRGGFPASNSSTTPDISGASGKNGP